MRWLVPVALVVMLACRGDDWPRPAPQSYQEFLTQFNAWREDRRDRLVQAPAGPVILAGLWELSEGATAMGRDSTLAIALPAPEAPPLAGLIRRTGQDVRFEPAPGARVRLADGTPVTAPRALASDRTDSATVLAIGATSGRDMAGGVIAGFDAGLAPA